MDSDTAMIDTGTPDQTVPATVQNADRIVSLDFIRGIAVMGILWANIAAFGQPMTAAIYPGAFQVATGDDNGWLWLAQFVLIDGKMRGLFTVLFGAGLMLFTERAWERGGTRWLQARRLGWLLLFGLVHYYLIWMGDILYLYALCGMVATFCLRWAAKTQLMVGISGFVAGSIVMAAMMGPLAFVADTDLGNGAAFVEMRDGLVLQEQDDLADAATEADIIANRTYTDIVAHTVQEHGKEPIAGFFFGFMETVPLMLIGAALYRYGLFDGGIERGKLLRWGWAMLIGGMVLTMPIGLWAVANGLTFWGTLAALTGFAPLPRLPMILGMLALLAAYAPQATGWLGQRISAAGRAAFTNYLGTSIVMMLAFHGWAGGLFGQMNRPQLLVVMVLACVVMLAWSKPWLDRFRYGPLEWLWRCLTYTRMFPLRR